MTTRRSKADLIYGATGTYKTSQIGHMAMYVLNKYGKKTRLVTADGGGFDPIKELVEAGVIEVWSIRTQPHLIEAIDKACQGWWPDDVDDPASPAKPPTSSRAIRDVGLVAFEGLTSFGSSIMEKLKKPGVQLSQDPSYVLQDGGTHYAGGSMAAFGFVQDRIYEFVMKSHMIPLVEHVLWTALEAKGEEEGTKIPIFGPAIEGKKATGKAGQWFGNLFHMEAVNNKLGVDEATQQIKMRTDVFCYMKNHADPVSGIVFPAKVRAPFLLADRLPDRVPMTTGCVDKEGKPVKIYTLRMVYEYLDTLSFEAGKLLADSMPVVPPPEPPLDEPSIIGK